MRDYLNKQSEDVNRAEYSIKWGMRDLMKDVMTKMSKLLPGVSKETAYLVWNGKKVDGFRRIEEYFRGKPDARLDLLMRPSCSGGGFLS